jgi:hypothetical protein
MTYAWKRDGALIDGQTGASLTLPDIAGTDAGVYSVVIRNSAGLTESDGVTVSVVQAVSIASQPEAASVVLGGSTLFQVAATGTEPITYQWTQDGVAIADATGSTLTLTIVETSAAGDYKVTVTNAAGSVDSDVVTLTVESPPAITELTGSMSLVDGDSVVLSVTAVGTAPITYQWSKGGVAVDGATGGTLSLANVAPSDADDYKVAVSNGAGRVESELITVTVVQSASIVSQPEGGSAVLGETFTLRVVAAGTEPISYQWHNGGQVVEGASGSSLSLANLEAVNSGDYHVVVSNQAGTETSDTVTLTLESPPLITELTESLSAAKGDTVEMSVSAVGTGPLVYQWKLEGVVISDGTSDSIELTDVDSLDAGQYTVEISNSAGIIVSDPIEVSVSTAPQVVSQPTSKNIGLNARLILTVSATGSGLEYQWYRDSQAITGGTDAVLTVPNAEASDSGSYHVIVTNTVGSITSEAAEVVVVAAPDILTQPEGGFAPLTGEFVMSVEAKGTGDVTYQWRVDGVVLEGETKNVLSLTDLKLSDAGAYAVEVVNEAGITMSQEAEVQVLIPVSVIEHPQDQSLVAGNLVLFEAVISGSNPIAYQWYFNGSPIDGAVEASIRIENSSSESQGGYYVVASNSVSTVTSEEGTLVVNLPPAVASHPAGGTVVKGDDTTLVVEVTGTGAFTYKWQRDGVDIDGATEPALTLTDVGAGDDALYTVLVENPYGIIVSDPAKLDVTLPVSITAQPEDTHVALNGTLALSVTVTGTGPFEYQWYRGDEKIEGAVEAEMQLSNMIRLNDGFYRVEVKNMLGAMFSREAAVVVDEPVSIVVQPIGATLLQGEGAMLWALATGSEPLSHQWQKDGVALAEQTGVSLALGSVVEADEGFYSVIITNPVGFEVSAEALVEVNSPPTIESLDSVLVSVGDTLQIQVVADDDGDLSKLKYVLRNQPEGMKISASGLIEWTVGSKIEAKIYNISIVVLDQNLLAAGRKLVVRVNQSPSWLAVAEQAVKEGRELIFKPVMTDSDDTEWIYTTGDFPEGATYNLQEGFKWTPGLGQVGTHDVSFTATDSHGASGTLVVHINVEANVAPTIAALDPVVVSIGEQLSVQVVADDPDGDSAKLKYNLQDAPDGMTISAGGLIEWMVDTQAIGGTTKVTVSVLDELASRPGNILVVTVNLPPTLAGIGSQTVQVGQVLTIKPSATDPEGGELVFVSEDLPTGAEFDASSGFSWMPTEEQLGVHEVLFEVKDPHGSEDDELVVIMVTPKPNVVPTIEALEPVLVSRGDKLSVQVVADDSDGDNAKLKYQLQNAPGEMTISAKGLIEWTTSPEAEGGTMEVTVVVLDELESRAIGLLTVTVNLPPALSGIGPQTVEAGQALVVKPSATDSDDTELVYSVNDLPVGAVFNPETGFRWTPSENQVGLHEVKFVVTDPHGAKSSEGVTITVTETVKEPSLTLLSSATVVGEYNKETEVALDENNKTFTVKMSGGMRFYKLRSTGEAKLKVTSIQLQGENAVISYTNLEE